VAFEPPVLGVVTGHEIGVTGGKVYWRFDRDGYSGIASGQTDGQGGGSTVVVQPTGSIVKFRVDRHVVFQTSQNGSMYLELIPSGTNTVRFLGYFSIPCVSLPSDDNVAYCRALNGGGSTYLYSLNANVPSYMYWYTLPLGNDLAIDGETLYFPEDHGAVSGQAIMESTPRIFDGGSPGFATVTQLVHNQTSPRELRVAGDTMFWLDDQSPNFTSANTAPKTGLDGGALITRAATGARFLAVDPNLTNFYVAIGTPGEGYSIVRGDVTTVLMTSFRTGITGLGGLAVDDRYVYWTQSDGRVYRAPKQ
jgi:hypothetical protein